MRPNQCQRISGSVSLKLTTTIANMSEEFRMAEAAKEGKKALAHFLAKQAA